MNNKYYLNFKKLYKFYQIDSNAVYIFNDDRLDFKPSTSFKYTAVMGISAYFFVLYLILLLMKIHGYTTIPSII